MGLAKAYRWLIIALLLVPGCQRSEPGKAGRGEYPELTSGYLRQMPIRVLASFRSRWHEPRDIYLRDDGRIVTWEGYRGAPERGPWITRSQERELRDAVERLEFFDLPVQLGRPVDDSSSCELTIVVGGHAKHVTLLYPDGTLEEDRFWELLELVKSIAASEGSPNDWDREK